MQVTLWNYMPLYRRWFLLSNDIWMESWFSIFMEKIKKICSFSRYLAMFVLKNGGKRSFFWHVLQNFSSIMRVTLSNYSSLYRRWCLLSNDIWEGSWLSELIEKTLKIGSFYSILAIFVRKNVWKRSFFWYILENFFSIMPVTPIKLYVIV